MSQIVIHNCLTESWDSMIKKNTLSTNIFLECNENFQLFAHKLNIIQKHFPYTIHIFSQEKNITDLIHEINLFDFISVSRCCCNFDSVENEFTKLVTKIAEYTLNDEFIPNEVQNIWDFKQLHKNIQTKRKKSKRYLYKEK